eukprot:TRINITY_DN48154_c0_g1_i1.p1 TRINITY_DN48154_c0_g1~~TRINITY_DN48154_c0_g1_i1.p1  ORF type:complete len:623 (-),score=52.48 TRINITY_DN48154_c0_g1_i1:67-1935(-)
MRVPLPALLSAKAPGSYSGLPVARWHDATADPIRDWSELHSFVNRSLTLVGGRKRIQECRCDDGLQAGATWMWRYVEDMDNFLQGQRSLTHVGGREAFIKFVPFIIDDVATAAWNCAPGVATILLTCLDVIDDRYGFIRAKAAFALGVGLAYLSRELTCPFRFSVSEVGYVGNSFNPNFESLPFLLGMTSDVLSCHESAPRIFVYDLDNDRWTRPLLTCSTGLVATDIWLHRELLRSSCRTDRPEEADLFFVPVYAHCLRSGSRGIEESTRRVTNVTEIYRGDYNELLGSLQYFRRRPQDHIFLFSNELWPVSERMLAISGPLGRSIILSPETLPIRCAAESFAGGDQEEEQGDEKEQEEQRRSGGDTVELAELLAARPLCEPFTPAGLSRVVVIPSFVDSWRANQLQSFNRPFTSRTVLGCFMGIGLKSRPGTKNYRHLLLQLQGVPGFYIGEYDLHYGQVMGDSVFCFIPQGIGTWTHRLYEALMAGCIPVILSDGIELPFPFLSWHHFTIKWPMRILDATFARYLRSIANHPTSRVVKAMVDLRSCWFNYHSPYHDCSPLVGTTRMLGASMQREQLKPDYSSGFWAPQIPGVRLTWNANISYHVLQSPAGESIEIAMWQ